MKKIYKILLNSFVVLLISPLTVLIIWSLTNSWTWPSLFPSEFSLNGLEYLITTDSIKSLITSLIISTIVVIITIIISLPAARAISLYEFKGKRFFELLIMSPIIIPTISVAMGIHITFMKIGIANTIVGVVIINIVPCIPYAVRILTDVYDIVGNKLEVQAKVLGANKFDTFKYISLPLIMPGIVSASSMCFIISFGQYFLTYLIGSGVVVTYPMIMFPYIQSGDRTIASLYSLVFLVVSVIVLFILEKKIKSYYNEEQTTFL
ncbi:ABC transporter permease subunit [Romboutsia sedimentorum]|uniref:ABC transporter permease subunit n=1 Tax=Romboutsia sedimentorum TaxID=1368474 RepID=A0ABT7EBG3_9FIRM|nr:ABC transporter permease subunit [Romboutsia sedimentorum]MDK2564037.1 ABC transporter permease subunit [Romboutsia sedimentorum]